MVAVLTPHFDLPFRMVGGSFAVVEQDSQEDIANCVEAIVRTPFASIPDSPDFGVDDHSFDNQPIDTNALTAQILNQEPRATILIEEQTDLVDNLIEHIAINVGGN